MHAATRTLGLAGLFGVLLGSARAAQDSPQLLSIQAEQRDGTTELAVLLSRSVAGSAVSWFSLSDPERLVVDIADASTAPGGIDLAPAGPVTSVAQELLRDASGQVLRLTFTLSQPVEPEIRVAADRVLVALAPGGASEDPLASAFGKPAATGAAAGTGDEASPLPGGRRLSGPELPPGAPPTLSSLDFENLEDVSRVVIGTNADLEAQVSHPESNLLVVDLPGAELAPSLDRPLDLSAFSSPIRTVRAYRTSRGARVAITLRRDAPYHLERHGRLYFLDVEVPEDLKAQRSQARQSFAYAAPAQASGEPLKGAYQQEVLIGSSGRTVNPAAVFGTGAGVANPASLFGLSAGFMTDTYSASDLPYTGQPISIDLVNADIHSVFRLISNVSHLNIVAGDDVSGKVTVRLENVPWDQAFAAILQAKGLGSQRFGNIVRIAPIETIKAEQQAALEAKNAADELEPLKLYVVPLNYATAGDVQSQVKSVLSSRGSIEVDSRSNQLIVRDTEAVLAQVRELVRQLDRQTPQVLIEARIVEASSRMTKGLGIEWGGELNASAATGYATGLFFPNSIGASGGFTTGNQPQAQFYSPGQDNLIADLGSPVGETSSLALSLGSIPGLIDLDARLSAMESEGWGRIVSSPKVTAMDNSEAYIKQGQRIPYLSTSAGGTQVQFITAALELTVKPHITSDGRILLDINVSNNRADFSQTVQGQPAIQIKEAQTSLLVDNGETKVIGGVFATERSFSQDRIPFLSKIPLLGYLFKNSGHLESRNEMLVFITPRILVEPKRSSGDQG